MCRRPPGVRPQPRGLVMVGSELRADISSQIWCSLGRVRRAGLEPSSALAQLCRWLSTHNTTCEVWGGGDSYLMGESRYLDGSLWVTHSFITHSKLDDHRPQGHGELSPLSLPWLNWAQVVRVMLLCSARLSAAARTLPGPRVWTSRSWHEAVAGSRYRYIPDHVQCCTSVLCTEPDINQRFQPILPAPSTRPSRCSFYPSESLSASTLVS